MRRQFKSIYTLKYDIKTSFFDYHEFELEITRKKKPRKIVWIFE